MAVLNGKRRKKNCSRTWFFQKRPRVAQPWLVAIDGWRLVEIAGWRLAVGGWRRLAAVGGSWRQLVVGDGWLVAVGSG